jgi:solute carrier family 25 phosphate transporter 3
MVHRIMIDCSVLAVAFLCCVQGFTLTTPVQYQAGRRDHLRRTLDRRRPLDRLFSTSQENKSPTAKEEAQEDADPPFFASFDENDPLHAKNLVVAADTLSKATSGEAVAAASPTTRRLLFAGGLIGVGAALGAASQSDSLKFPTTTPVVPRNKPTFGDSRLQWEVTPINKRTGVTVYDAEQAGYNVRFVTYLSRFLLSFDADCQRWWYSRAQDLPRFASAEEVTNKRLQQFAAFSASVEVGLQAYEGSNGPGKLLASLQQRYCPDNPSARREQSGLLPLSQTAQEKQEREIKEARRQIALLFGLMETNQPATEITKILAAIDNGKIGRVELINPGSGYAPGYGPPQVVFPPPEAGEDYEQASGRAILELNGRILRIDVVNRGYGYKNPPTITVAPPAALRFKSVNETVVAEEAQAKAILFRSGPNKGRIERILLTSPGVGYAKSEIIKVRLAPPDLSLGDGGVTATATAILEYQVARIELINVGTGYAVEKPMEIYVEPPPLTARVNMNDPLMARVVDPSKPLPATTIPSPEMLKRMPNPADFAKTLSLEANRADCIGRGCYDTAVKAVAYPVAEKDSYTVYRTDADTEPSQTVERALNKRSEASSGRVVSASTSGKDAQPPELPSLGVASPISSSAQLLSLLPAGVGLEFDEKDKRYKLAVDPEYEDSGILKSWKSYEAFDPDFGPRGRTPIQKDMDLGFSTYLRFVASGAICCSGVHLALTPIDVVKTNVQTDPDNYPNVPAAFQRVLRERGVSGFFAGWAPTFVGFFFWGGVAYSITEFLRRTFQVYAGDAAGSLEVPIILTAAGLAAIVGSFVICPFEATRIRSVAQPDYAPNIIAVLKRMVDEEGVGTLFSAAPAFMAKEVPFAMAKFTVFDLSTAWMYENFPAAREDLQLSLLVSLVGGTIGGLVAAVVSNPADATISELKKTKSDMSVVAAAQLVVEKGGIGGLFRGLPLRLVFYSLMVSMQFLIYDAVRFALGVGSDDLKLYLDVLGGALRETGGPT